jgi:hypothetical protein
VTFTAGVPDARRPHGPVAFGVAVAVGATPDVADGVDPDPGAPAPGVEEPGAAAFPVPDEGFALVRAAAAPMAVAAASPATTAITTRRRTGGRPAR